MSEKLTVAELLARNAKDGGRKPSDRPRRRRNLDDGGVSVSELTGSIPVVKVDEDAATSAKSGDAGTARVAAGRGATPPGTRGGHEADPVDAGSGPGETESPGTGVAAAPVVDAEVVETGTSRETPADTVTSPTTGGHDDQSTIVQAIIPDSLLSSPNPSAEFAAVTPEQIEDSVLLDRNGRGGIDDTSGGDDGSAGDRAGTGTAQKAPVADGVVGEGPTPSVAPTTSASSVGDAVDVADATVIADTPDADGDTDGDDAEAPAPAGTATAATSSPAGGAGVRDTSDRDTSERDTSDRDTSDGDTVAAPTSSGKTKKQKRQKQATAPKPSRNEVVEYEDDTISWPALIGQAVLAVVVGVLIFFGFTLLWDNLSTVLVLVMALVVTFVCVGVVHALLRHRDTLILVLTFVVGIALTVGPRLIMSI